MLDTNSLASGIAGYDAAERAPGRLLRLWRAGRFELVVSDHILGELFDTFANPYFQRQLSPEQIAAAQLLLEEEATWTALTVSVIGVASHPEDDFVLAAAVSARVDYLVTGDRQLRRLGAYRGVAILSPREFLDVLEREADGGG